MEEERLKNLYKKMFEKYSNSNFKDVLNERGFVFQYDEDEEKTELLFIGINPSYTEKHEQGYKYADSYNREDTKTRQYFKPFWDISEQISDKNSDYNGKWTHIDLLVFRETNQKYIKNTLFKDDAGLDFIMEQLEIAKERLIKIKPKVIIVNNTMARKFLGKDRDGNNDIWMGLDFVFNEEYGTFQVTNLPELEKSHFLFTSMLSGQRALDLGSKERLIWQVKRIFKK